MCHKTTYSCVETGAHSVAQAGLQLSMQPGLALNSLHSSCLNLISVGITGVSYHIQPTNSFEWDNIQSV